MASGIATTGAIPPTGSVEDPVSHTIGQPDSSSSTTGLQALSSPPAADPKSDMVNKESPVPGRLDAGEQERQPEPTVPKSIVADHPYPNVPDTVPGQAAATDPSAGGELANGPAGSTGGQVPFKEQVNGYAKKFAGMVFRNKNEKEFGEAKLQGDA